MPSVAETFMLDGRRVEVVSEKLVTVDYYKTVRRHGVEVKEYSPYSYTAIAIREVSHDATA